MATLTVVFRYCFNWKRGAYDLFIFHGLDNVKYLNLHLWFQINFIVSNRVSTFYILMYPFLTSVFIQMNISVLIKQLYIRLITLIKLLKSVFFNCTSSTLLRMINMQKLHNFNVGTCLIILVTVTIGVTSGDLACREINR